METRTRFSPYSLFISHSLSPIFFIILHLASYTCLFGMLQQLLWSSWHLTPLWYFSLSFPSLHSPPRSLTHFTFLFPSCLFPSFIYPSFCVCFSSYVFPSFTNFCLTYVIPCIFLVVCTIHPLPISLVPTFISGHVCDL